MAGKTNITEALAGSPLFQGASPDAIAALARAATTSHWPSGTVIFQTGDPSDFLAVVTAGRIRLSIVTAAGRELVLRHAVPGDVLGEMGVLDHLPRSADATTAAPTEAVTIQRRVLDAAMAQHPDLATAVIRYLTRRLRETTYQLESVALYSLSGRLARYLLALLRHSHGDDLPDHATLTLDLGQGEIAAILGASRPKLNRAFADLEDQSAITRKDKSVTCDTGLLQEIADAGEP